MNDQDIDWWFAPGVAVTSGVAGGLLAVISHFEWAFAWIAVILLAAVSIAGVTIAVRGAVRTSVLAPSIGALLASLVTAVIGLIQMTGR